AHTRPHSFPTRRSSDLTLAVDANGRFDTAQALAYAEALRDYPLHWYEEPTDPLDYAALAAVAGAYPGPLATGENLLSFPDARNRSEEHTSELQSRENLV